MKNAENEYLEPLWPPLSSSLCIGNPAETNSINPVVVRNFNENSGVYSLRSLPGDTTLDTSAIIEDGTGIIYFAPSIAVTTPDFENYTLGLAVENIVYNRYFIRVDDRPAPPLQSVIVWPTADSVLPLDTDIIIHAFQIQPNGLLPGNWQQQLAPLTWSSSPAGLVQGLPDPPPISGNYPYYVRRATLRIPSQNAPSTVGITVQSAIDSPVQVTPVTQTWRVAVAQPTRNQLYLAPPLDGAKLPTDYAMPAVATFLDPQGNPVPSARVTWSWVPGLRTLPPAPAVINAQTDENGKSYATISCRYDGNPNSAWNYLQTLQVQAGTQNTARSNNLQFTRRGPFKVWFAAPGASDMPLSSGTPHPVQVSYPNPFTIDETFTITWTTDPYDSRISFDPPASNTDSRGSASTTVTAQAGVTLSNVSIVAMTPNPYSTDGVDTATLPVSFEPESVLSGIAIDQAMAANAFDGQYHPNDPDTAITAAVRLLPPPSRPQQVTLQLSSSATFVSLFDTNSKELAKNNDGDYFVSIDSSAGQGSFKIASRVFALFTLTATYQNESLSSPAQLLLADIDNAPPGDIDSPLIDRVKPGGTLTIPDSTSKPDYTFQVRMDIPDDQNDITDSTPLVLWLNDRIVFTGQGSDLDNENSVPVAYAALRTDGQFNKLLCVYNYTSGANNLTLASKPLLFKASGTPLTAPWNGAVRTLTAPQGLPGTATPWDCAQGLTLALSYDNARAGDKITLYCYLQGSASMGEPRHNVLRFDITRANQDPTVTIPQVYLAGYPSGSTLKADYVVNGNTWSFTASATLDTADIGGV